MEEQAKDIAFCVLKSIAAFGDKAGRFIYVDFWHNELIGDAAKKLEIEVTDNLRSLVETKLTHRMAKH